MNQEKIGKFIAELRKTKGLTQSQLAEHFGISNKAVSKWETGKSLPDASIMIDLCNLLGITVNELLSGERISMEDYKEKAEENIIGVAADGTHKQRNLKKIIGVLLAVLFVCVGLLVYTNRPYKAISFVLNGDGYSAEVVNGDTLLLQLDNAKGENEWFSVMSPEFYTCVSMDVKEEYTEFRIRALSEGNGDMGFLCIENDGTKENFVLNLSISRQQKNALQIDTVTFEKHE